MSRSNGLVLGFLSILVLAGCAGTPVDAGASSTAAVDAPVHRTMSERPVDRMEPAVPPATAASSPGTVAAGADADEAPLPVEPPAVQPSVEASPIAEAPVDDLFPSLEEREGWLAHQQIVRDCMAAAGQTYLYWEWWSNEGGAFAAMPEELVGDARAAWELALYGDTGLGADYRWQDAGCWGYAAEVTGSTH